MNRKSAGPVEEPAFFIFCPILSEESETIVVGEYINEKLYCTGNTAFSIGYSVHITSHLRKYNLIIGDGILLAGYDPVRDKGGADSFSDASFVRQQWLHAWAVGAVFLIQCTRKVRKNPKASIFYGVQGITEQVEYTGMAELSPGRSPYIDRISDWLPGRCLWSHAWMERS